MTTKNAEDNHKMTKKGTVIKEARDLIEMEKKARCFKSGCPAPVLEVSKPLKSFLHLS